MDEKQKNTAISIVVGCTAIAITMSFYWFFVVPIQEHEKDKFLQYCEENDLECTADPNEFLPFMIGIIPAMVFFATYYYLENKRMKTWRSYK